MILVVQRLVCWLCFLETWDLETLYQNLEQSFPVGTESLVIKYNNADSITLIEKATGVTGQTNTDTVKPQNRVNAPNCFDARREAVLQTSVTS